MFLSSSTYSTRHPSIGSSRNKLQLRRQSMGLSSLQAACVLRDLDLRSYWDNWVFRYVANQLCLETINLSSTVHQRLMLSSIKDTTPCLFIGFVMPSFFGLSFLFIWAVKKLQLILWASIGDIRVPGHCCFVCYFGREILSRWRIKYGEEISSRTIELEG